MVWAVIGISDVSKADLENHLGSGVGGTVSRDGTGSLSTLSEGGTW